MSKNPDGLAPVKAIPAAMPLAGVLSLLPDQAFQPLASASQPGGGDRDRTDDLMLAKHALSQLSYAPTGKDQENSGGPGKT